MLFDKSNKERRQNRRLYKKAGKVEKTVRLSDDDLLDLTTPNYAYSYEFAGFEQNLENYVAQLLAKISVDEFNTDVVDALIDRQVKSMKQFVHMQYIRHLGSLSSIRTKIEEKAQLEQQAADLIAAHIKSLEEEHNRLSDEKGGNFR